MPEAPWETDAAVVAAKEVLWFSIGQFVSGLVDETVVRDNLATLNDAVYNATNEEWLGMEGRCPEGHNRRLTYELWGRIGCVACDRDKAIAERDDLQEELDWLRKDAKSYMGRVGIVLRRIVELNDTYVLDKKFVRWGRVERELIDIVTSAIAGERKVWGDLVIQLREAMVKAVLPLEVLRMTEVTDGPIREISPSLRALIAAGSNAVREALVAAALEAPAPEPHVATVTPASEAEHE